MLSKDYKKRKDTPLYRGFMRYFPDAMVLVAQLSAHANAKHNPGEELHWSKDKSSDHMDCLMRHALEVGTWDADNNCDHAVPVAWRAMSNLQTMFENGELAVEQSNQGTIHTHASGWAAMDADADELPEDHDEYAAVRGAE